jgi:hypothetical protein
VELSDLGYRPGETGSITDNEARRLRDELVDGYIASITDAELQAIREMVALDRDDAYANGGAVIRRSDPRLSPAVRAQIFALLPKPYRPPVQLQLQQGGAHAHA